jgi:hypothetical protein
MNNEKLRDKSEINVLICSFANKIVQPRHCLGSTIQLQNCKTLNTPFL